MHKNIYFCINLRISLLFHRGNEILILNYFYFCSSWTKQSQNFFYQPLGGVMKPFVYIREHDSISQLHSLQKNYISHYLPSSERDNEALKKKQTLVSIYAFDSCQRFIKNLSSSTWDSQKKLFEICQIFPIKGSLMGSKPAKPHLPSLYTKAI